ncbi:MAG: DUF1559 domain-containing protein [Pirellulaceae bacterium]|nr:DUF1559 domain-containing protein [Pirellulaceae bacterium]
MRTSIQAQAPASATTNEVLQLVTPDAVAMLTVQPRAISQSEMMSSLPVEVFSAMSLESIGLDPFTIERVDAIVGVPNFAGIPAGGLVTFSEAIPEEFMGRFKPLDPKANKGIELFEAPGLDGVVIHPKNPRQALVGTKAFVLRALSSPADDGPLRKMARGLGEPSAVSLVVAIEPVRDLLASATEMPAMKQVPQITQDVDLIIAKTDMLAMRVQLGAKPVTAYMLQTANPQDALEVNASLARLVKVGMQMLISTMAQQAANEPGRTPMATIAYLKRLAPEIERYATFKPSGNRLLLLIEGQQLTLSQGGILVGLLLPAVQAARQAARRMQSSNNLKQLALGILNYESAYRYLPSDAEPPAPGETEAKSNLSWRVKILPFIEQQQLYEQFHLDEPWDSPHNIKLLPLMPDSYRHPNSLAKPGHTVYQMPTGPKLAAEPGKRLRLRDFTDGTSNTIAIVETTDQAATPWTKPDDVNPYDNPAVLRNTTGIFQASLLDGSARAISVTIDPQMLKGLLTRNGGETVEP